ncbi:MAG: hypothetical protein ACI9TY_000393 [Alphaproteobacteria bacterium]|jgi:hypothetical protein
MAFPDYGPLKDIAQFSQDGFAQGSLLFKMFAGEVVGTQALHYIGLTFALIGALAIVFIKKFHNIVTIVSWTFLVIILLIGPRQSEHFFAEIKVNVDPSKSTVGSVDNTIYAFTPQAVVIDFMSKIHRAIYLGLFDITDPANPRMRNAITDLVDGVSGSSPADTQLNERHDILFEIQAYKTLECGPESSLSLPLYDHEWEKKLMVETPVNSGQWQLKDDYVPYGISTVQLSAEKTNALQQNYFKLASIQDLLSNYGSGYAEYHGKVYAPFSVVNLDADDVGKTLKQSGVKEKEVDRAVQQYIKNNAAYILNGQLSTLSYAMMNKKTLVDDINTADSFRLIGPPPTLNSPTMMAYITNSRGADDYTTWGATDPIEKRLQSETASDFNRVITQVSHSAGIEFERKNPVATSWYNMIIGEGGGTNIGSTPAGIVFITPTIISIYDQRKSEPVSGRAKRPLGALAKKPYLNLVNNCAQLHFMIRNHTRDALMFQNTWPSHGQDVDYIKTGVPNQKTGDFAEPMGLSNTVTSGTRNFLLYPYRQDNATMQMNGLYLRYQSIAKTMTYQDTTVSPIVEHHALSDASTNVSAAEVARRLIIKNLIDSGFKNSTMPMVITKGSTIDAKEAQAEAIAASNSNMDKAMQTSGNGHGAEANLKNIGSELGFAVEWVAETATKIGAQFAGIGALAYVKFLQMFISIAIFFILMCTPILFMMGLVVPSHAPGVIVVSLISVLALKAIPIGYTLVDAVMSIAMQRFDILDYTKLDYALMIYVTAAAYTSVTMVTFFLLFKAGDASTVLGQISQMDSKANEAADTAAAIVKGVAGAAALAVTAGVGGAIGGIASGKGVGKAALSGGNQMKEVFGKNGLSAIPGAGNAFQEVTGSYREGKAETSIRGEVTNNNKNIDNLNAEIDAELSGSKGPISPERRKELEDNKSTNEAQRKSYGSLVSANKDSQAENKYRNQTAGGAEYFAGGRAHKEGQRIAKERGTSMEEISRENREAAAKSGVYQSIGSAVKTMELKDAKVDMAGSKIQIDAEAARAIQQGQSAASNIRRVTSPDKVVAAEQSAFLAEHKAAIKQSRERYSGKLRNTPGEAVVESEIVDPKTGERRTVNSTMLQDEVFARAEDAVRDNINGDGLDSSIKTIAAGEVTNEIVDNFKDGKWKINKDSFSNEAIQELYKSGNNEAINEFEGLVSKANQSNDPGKLTTRTGSAFNTFAQGSKNFNPSNLPNGADISILETVMASNKVAHEKATRLAKQRQNEFNKIASKDKAHS